MVELTWYGKSGDDKSGTMQVVTNGEPINIQLKDFRDFLTIERAINTATNDARRKALNDAAAVSRDTIHALRGD